TVRKLPKAKAPCSLLACYQGDAPGGCRRGRVFRGSRITGRFGSRVAETRPKLEKRNGRHVGTRTPDFYRVNSLVQTLKPFGFLAFPHSASAKQTETRIRSLDSLLFLEYFATKASNLAQSQEISMVAEMSPQ